MLILSVQDFLETVVWKRVLEEYRVNEVTIILSTASSYYLFSNLPNENGDDDRPLVLESSALLLEASFHAMLDGQGAMSIPG